MIAASTAFSLPGMKTRPLGAVSTRVLIWYAFVGRDYELAMYLNYWSYVLNYVASATETWFVIFYFELWWLYVVRYLWTVVIDGVLCWIMYDLGLL
jgi:hypothetical protein